MRSRRLRTRTARRRSGRGRQRLGSPAKPIAAIGARGTGRTLPPRSVIWRLRATRRSAGRAEREVAGAIRWGFRAALQRVATWRGRPPSAARCPTLDDRAGAERNQRHGEYPAELLPCGVCPGSVNVAEECRDEDRQSPEQEKYTCNGSRHLRVFDASRSVLEWLRSGPDTWIPKRSVDRAAQSSHGWVCVRAAQRGEEGAGLASGVLERAPRTPQRAQPSTGCSPRPRIRHHASLR